MTQERDDEMHAAQPPIKRERDSLDAYFDRFDNPPKRPTLLKGPLSPEEEARFKKRSFKTAIVVSLVLLALFAIIGVTKASSIGGFLLVQAAISGVLIVTFPLNLRLSRLTGRFIMINVGRKPRPEADGGSSP